MPTKVKNKKDVKRDAKEVKAKPKYKKFELEYPIHASRSMLYNFITTPGGLSEWFADDVNIKQDRYTFFWEKSEQTATLVNKKENHLVRFHWDEEPSNTYFEFRIEQDELTSDVALIVTDFAEDDASVETATLLWNSQVEVLMHVIGA